MSSAKTRVYRGLSTICQMGAVGNINISVSMASVSFFFVRVQRKDVRKTKRICCTSGFFVNQTIFQGYSWPEQRLLTYQRKGLSFGLHYLFHRERRNI